ncbi:RNA-directed DNA polymerase, eukaryota, Reverse transcriptase zinc-binding domain protein [Artemisia annua]|uniref:RNA-directed DNA polymerase, eukaryota, Reverse transcriptase zinc-binding domain protein n=1 Tax=Artemisia annua TaxID=35608 RepID=A0A2U1Q6K8_ARTAN|nr:RNA-directed DNA polymerase, eukaryota, Reverse transcriptase zinc-binding domain protein [Artemisia annua]
MKLHSPSVFQFLGRHVLFLRICIDKKENNPNCYIRDRWVLANGNWGGCWSWRIQPRGRSASEHDTLLSIINGLSLVSEESDGWKCWNSWVPRKVNVFNWRALNDRTPHISNLDKRGIDIHSLLCPICETEVEDINHIMFNCPKVKAVWSKCYDWWGIPTPEISSAINIGSSNIMVQEGNKDVAKIFHGVCLVTLWAVWSWRNRVVHALNECKQKIRNEDIFSQIQILSFLWISNRCKLIGFNWSIWVNNPKAVAGAIT